MTTPKCVLGVLSSGALGGAETTGGLDGFLLEVVLFSVTGRKRSKRRKKTRSNRSRGLSAPQGAHGTAPDVGSGILSFLLVSGSVQVLSGWVSSFRPTTQHLHFDYRCLAECLCGQCVFTVNPSKKHRQSKFY